MCRKTSNTTEASSVVYELLVHKTNFLIPCFMIFGVLFGFSGFVFCFYFFLVSPETRIEYSTSSYTANKKSKGNTFYTIFIFCCFNNHPEKREIKLRARKDISRRMWSSVLCKLQKSLSIFFSFIFYDSDQVGYNVGEYFYFFHSTAEQIEWNYTDRRQFITNREMWWVEICAKISWLSTKDFRRELNQIFRY